MKTCNQKLKDGNCAENPKYRTKHIYVKNILFNYKNISNAMGLYVQLIPLDDEECS